MKKLFFYLLLRQILYKIYPGQVVNTNEKIRILILTDIENEPDVDE